MSNVAVNRAGLLNSDTDKSKVITELVTEPREKPGSRDQTLPEIGRSASSSSSAASATTEASTLSLHHTNTSMSQDTDRESEATPAATPCLQPLNTRVFDVYIKDGSPRQKKLPDIFDYKAPNEPDNSIAGVPGALLSSDVGKAGVVEGQRLPGAHVLINTGRGRNVSLPATINMVHKRSSFSTNSDRAKSLSLALEQKLPNAASHVQLQPQHQPQPLGTPYSATGVSFPQPQLQPHNSSGSSDLPTPISAHSMTSAMVIPPESLTNNDKWPPHVETAFIHALQMLMKNGTAKIKVKDTNFGRNELISLYIKYKTGEVRSKKQISSHIQVWKKSITNKINNDIQTSAFESELLDLIEHGAKQTAENWDLFERTFNVVVDEVENPMGHSDARKANSQINSMDYNAMYGIQGQPNQYPHPQLHQQHLGHQQQPHAAMYYHPHSGLSMLPYHSIQVKEPATPLEFAQELYGGLSSSFKCVPVNPYEQYKPYPYTNHMQQGMIQQPQPQVHTYPQQEHPQQRSSIPMPGSATTMGSGLNGQQLYASRASNQTPMLKTPQYAGSPASAQSLYQVAKEVKNQQKKLIDELYQKQVNPQDQKPLPNINSRTADQHQGSQTTHSVLPPVSHLNPNSPLISSSTPGPQHTT